MVNLLIALKISTMRFSQCLRAPRTWVIGVLMLIYGFSIVQPVADFAKQAGCLVTPYAPVFVIDDIVCQLFILIAAIALFSSAPYRDDIFPYLVARAGKGNMVVGNVLGILWISVAYVVFIFVVLIAPLLGGLEWAPNWGKLWNTLAAYPPDHVYGIVFEVNDGLRANLPPGIAMMFTFSLEVLCVTFLGLCVYIGNLWSRRPYGIWVACAVALFDITIYNVLSSSMLKYSPSSLARISNYTSSYFLPMGRSTAYGYLFIGIGILVMSGLAYFLEQIRKDAV